MVIVGVGQSPFVRLGCISEALGSSQALLMSRQSPFVNLGMFLQDALRLSRGNGYKANVICQLVQAVPPSPRHLS
jgi:hypothetical protein